MGIGARHHAHLAGGSVGAGSAADQHMGRQRHDELSGSVRSVAPVTGVKHGHRAQRHGVVGVDDYLNPAGVVPRVRLLPPLIDTRGGLCYVRLPVAEDVPQRHDQRPGVMQHREVDQRLDP